MVLVWRIVDDSPNSPNFLPTKFSYYTVLAQKSGISKMHRYARFLQIKSQIVMLCFFTWVCVEYQRKQDSTVFLQYQSIVIDIKFVNIQYCISFVKHLHYKNIPQAKNLREVNI